MICALYSHVSQKLNCFLILLNKIEDEGFFLLKGLTLLCKINNSSRWFLFCYKNFIITLENFLESCCCLTLLGKRQSKGLTFNPFTMGVFKREK